MYPGSEFVVEGGERMRPGRFAQIILTLAILTAGTVFPLQGQVITGTISGTIVDSTGSLVPEAKVTATNTSTGLVRTTATGTDGQFVLPFLPVGSYTVKVEHTGFKSFVREAIQLSVNQIAVIDAQLSVGDTKETVT